MIMSMPHNATASPIATPELVRHARLRRFGLSASTLRVVALHAFGDCGERLICAPAVGVMPSDIGGVRRG
jgi:hypothetical protein